MLFLTKQVEFENKTLFIAAALVNVAASIIIRFEPCYQITLLGHRARTPFKDSLEKEIKILSQRLEKTSILTGHKQICVTIVSNSMIAKLA